MPSIHLTSTQNPLQREPMSATYSARFFSFTPPCPLPGSDSKIQRILTAPSPFLLTPPFPAAFRLPSTCLPHPLQNRDSRSTSALISVEKESGGIPQWPPGSGGRVHPKKPGTADGGCSRYLALIISEPAHQTVCDCKHQKLPEGSLWPPEPSGLYPEQTGTSCPSSHQGCSAHPDWLEVVNSPAPSILNWDNWGHLSEFPSGAEPQDPER